MRAPTRWMLPFFAAVLTVLVVSSALNEDPHPSLQGRGLLVLAALVGFVATLLAETRGCTATA